MSDKKKKSLARLNHHLPLSRPGDICRLRPLASAAEIPGQTIPQRLRLGVRALRMTAGAYLCIHHVNPSEPPGTGDRQILMVYTSAVNI